MVVGRKKRDGEPVAITVDRAIRTATVCSEEIIVLLDLMVNAFRIKFQWPSHGEVEHLAEMEKATIVVNKKQILIL